MKTIFIVALIAILSCNPSKDYFLKKEDIQFKDSLNIRLCNLEESKLLKIDEVFYLTNDFFMEQTSLKDSIESLKNTMKKSIKIIDDYANENNGIINKNKINTITLKERYDGLKKNINSNSILDICTYGSGYAVLSSIFISLDEPKYKLQSDSLIPYLDDKTSSINFFLRNYGINDLDSYFNLKNENKYLFTKYTFKDSNGNKISKMAVFYFRRLDDILLELKFNQYVKNQ